MRVSYLPAARKGLKKMPEAMRKGLMDKIDRYAATGEGDVKRLSGSPAYRLRHGDWRAIFTVEKQVIVVRVAHRREVYR